MTAEIWTIISVEAAIAAIVVGQGRFNMSVIKKRFEAIDKKFEGVDNKVDF